MAKTTAAPTELARRTVSTAAHLQDFSMTGLGPSFKSATATFIQACKGPTFNLPLQWRFLSTRGPMVPPT